MRGHGSTPSEAVVRLWLALNKKIIDDIGGKENIDIIDSLIKLL